MKSNRFLYSLAYIFLLGVPSLILYYSLPTEIDWSALAVLIVISLTVGGVFDIWSTRQSRRDAFFIWEYNSKSILGFKICGVPVEDYVFFLVLTPFFMVIFYESLRILLQSFTFSSFLFFGLVLLFVSYSLASFCLATLSILSRP